MLDIDFYKKKNIEYERKRCSDELRFNKYRLQNFYFKNTPYFNMIPTQYDLTT